MKNNQKRKAILWLIHQGFYLLVENQTQMLSFAFTTESVRYLDVINELKLQEQIQQFIQQNKLDYLRIYMVIGSDALLEKNLQSVTEPTKSDEEKQFLDLVPFENIYSKTWLKDKSIKIIAFNADIYKNIETVLRKNNGNILSVIPYFLTGQNTPSLITMQDLLKKNEIFKQENMINNNVFKDNLDGNIDISNKPNKPKSQLPLLLGVFGILIVVITVLIISQTQSPSKIASQTIKASSNISPTIYLNQNSSASTSAKLRDQIKIKIMNGSGIKTLPNDIIVQLKELGFKQIEATESGQISATNNLIIFKPDIDTKIRTEVLNQLGKILSNINSQNNASIDSDIIISTTINK
ncbi:MAG: hypothetical protein Q7R95_05175 [bacterium]|nr:hypothetical protein [bacterium]